MRAMQQLWATRCHRHAAGYAFLRPRNSACGASSKRAHTRLVLKTATLVLLACKSNRLAYAGVAYLWRFTAVFFTTTLFALRCGENRQVSLLQRGWHRTFFCMTLRVRALNQTGGQNCYARFAENGTALVATRGGVCGGTLRCAPRFLGKHLPSARRVSFLACVPLA